MMLQKQCLESAFRNAVSSSKIAEYSVLGQFYYHLVIIICAILLAYPIVTHFPFQASNCLFRDCCRWRVVIYLTKHGSGKRAQHFQFILVLFVKIFQDNRHLYAHRIRSTEKKITRKTKNHQSRDETRTNKKYIGQPRLFFFLLAMNLIKYSYPSCDHMPFSCLLC